ncbi:hypothetical protein GCM10009106_12290 [Sphingomonas japonica]
MPSPLAIVLALVAMLALAVPALVVAYGPRVTPVTEIAQAAQRSRQRVVPPSELPPVEPIEFVPVSRDDARLFNASIPFSTAPLLAAKPFAFTGDDASRARAVDCLAAAVLYEAGDDTADQKAVAQVVLNRVRHPAFPGTVCGVVFQGSERRTGCQFTFTCDGALGRRYSDAAWERARGTAAAAIGGSVDKRVGLSTHYHTDWVVPYWSSSLDKVSEVDTHLFFRWTGWWGTPPAFGRGNRGLEPLIASLSRISVAHAAAADGDAAGTIAVADLGSAELPGALPTDPNTFLVTLDKRLVPDQFAALAERTCGNRPYCKLMGWTDAALKPALLPAEPQAMNAMAFSYLRDRARGFEKALWNCDAFEREDAGQCMKRRAPIQLRAMPATPARMLPGGGLRAALGLDAPPKPAPPVLDGVRRKGEAAAPVPMIAPTPTPTPTP